MPAISDFGNGKFPSLGANLDHEKERRDGEREKERIKGQWKEGRG